MRPAYRRTRLTPPHLTGRLVASLNTKRATAVSDNTPENPQSPATPPVPPYATTPPAAPAQPGAYPPPPVFGATPPAPPQAQQYGAPQSPYGAAAQAPYGTSYGYVGPKTNVLAVIAMIASILGALWILPIIGSIGGAIMGHISLKQIAANGEKGRGMALAGVIVGWVGLGLFVLIVGAIIAIGFAAALESSRYS